MMGGAGVRRVRLDKGFTGVYYRDREGAEGIHFFFIIFFKKIELQH